MKNLTLLREKIDKIDEAIIKKLAMREKISRKIGIIKSTVRKPIKDSQREAQQKKQYEQLCLLYQLDVVFINRLFRDIIAHSREIQKNVR
jgi:chorismate mutase